MGKNTLPHPPSIRGNWEIRQVLRGKIIKPSIAFLGICFFVSLLFFFFFFLFSLFFLSFFSSLPLLLLCIHYTPPLSFYDNLNLNSSIFFSLCPHKEMNSASLFFLIIIPLHLFASNCAWAGAVAHYHVPY